MRKDEKKDQEDTLKLIGIFAVLGVLYYIGFKILIPGFRTFHT